MAPIVLESHSCRHCQNFVINRVIKDEERRNHEDTENAQERLYERFDYTVTDILAAAAEDCSFCIWLLDNEEWIHRSAFEDHVSSSPRYQGPQNKEKFESILQLCLRLDSWLPPSNPANTLRGYCTENQDEQLNSLRLACFYNDNLVIKFFGLWNPIAKHIEYRTRTGFSYFAELGALPFSLS
jgi:hypothetical protein